MRVCGEHIRIHSHIKLHQPKTTRVKNELWKLKNNSGMYTITCQIYSICVHIVFESSNTHTHTHVLEIENIKGMFLTFVCGKYFVYFSCYFSSPILSLWYSSTLCKTCIGVYFHFLKMKNSYTCKTWWYRFVNVKCIMLS